MINSEQLWQGILRYADAEVIPALNTPGKWALGTYIVLIGARYKELVKQLVEHPLIAALNVVNSAGLIDEDNVLTALRASAEKYGKLTVNLPVVGSLSFCAEDVNVLSQYIRS